jgi:GntR family transcriptional regulator, arabinose operon transcriptional repressor
LTVFILENKLLYGTEEITALIPLYQIIINTIQEQIQTGEFRKDDKLPSEAQLMEEYHTSRITVTRALKELEHREVIYRLKGKGSFVKGSGKKKSSASKIISLVLPHKEDFFSGGQQYARQISQSCRERGYLCSLHYSDQSTTKERHILNEIASHDVSGAIIYPISNRNIASLSRMKIEGFPMVLLDRKLEELSLPVITSDNFTGAFEAVSYLADKGHKRIGFVGANGSDVVQLRYKGYCHALMDNGIPLDRDLLITSFSGRDEDERGALDEQESLVLLKDLLKKGVTALFCVNDLIAFRFLNSAQELHISVPKELSLVGFDNLRYFNDTAIELTTVAQDFETIARSSVDALISKIESRKDLRIEDLIVPTTFLEGNTVYSLK